MNKVCIPKLRFSGFDGDWGFKRLGDLSKLITKGTTPKNFIQKGIKFIKLECFEGDRINPNKCLFIDEKTHNKELKRSILNEGDILFAIAGATIGKVNIVNNEILPANTNQALAIIRLKENENREFIYHNLKSDIMRKYILDNISVGAQPNLNLEQMNNFSFFLPSLPEQQKIASFLSSVDEKIQQLSRKKELLEQYKKGVMQQLFSGKLRFKPAQSEVEGMNGEDYADWEEKKLGEVCKLNPKSSLLPSSFIYIDLESVVNGQLLKETRIQLCEAPSRAQRLLSKNDILFQMVRPYQKNNLFFSGKGEYVASTGYAQLRAKESPMFLYQLIHTTEFVNKVIDRCTGTSYPAINSTDLSNIEISIPSLPEQQKIANFLSGIDDKIENTHQEINNMQGFKKGLLQQMFV